jgi:hypothetical protein
VTDADAIVWKVIKSTRDKKELIRLLVQSHQETVEENRLLAEKAIGPAISALEECDLLGKPVEPVVEPEPVVEEEPAELILDEEEEEKPEPAAAPEVEKIDDNTIVVEPEPVEEAPEPVEEPEKKSLIDRILGK